MKNTDAMKYNNSKYFYEKVQGGTISRYNKHGLCSRTILLDGYSLNTAFNKKGIPLSQILLYFDGTAITTKFVYKKDKLWKVCRDFTVATNIDKIMGSAIESHDKLGRYKYDSVEFITEDITLRKTEYSTGVIRKRLYRQNKRVIDFIDNPILNNGGFKFYLPKEELIKLFGKSFIDNLIYHPPFSGNDDFMWSTDYWEEDDHE